MKRLFAILFLLTLQILDLKCGYLTPEHVEDHIKSLIAERYQLYVINLGTTVNSNPLKAYVISGTPSPYFRHQKREELTRRIDRISSHSHHQLHAPKRAILH